MRTRLRLFPMILVGGVPCAAGHEERLPQNVSGAPSEQSPLLLANAASGADKSNATVRCEHSKLNTQDADPLGEGAWQLQFNFGYSRAIRHWDPSWQEE